MTLDMLLITILIKFETNGPLIGLFSTLHIFLLFISIYSYVLVMFLFSCYILCSYRVLVFLIFRLMRLCLNTFLKFSFLNLNNFLRINLYLKNILLYNISFHFILILGSYILRLLIFPS